MIICETFNDCPVKYICSREKEICYDITTSEDRNNEIIRLIAARKDDCKKNYCLFAT